LRLDAGLLLDAEWHAERLLSGAAWIGLDPPSGWREVSDVVHNLLVAAWQLGSRPESQGVLRCQWSATGDGRGYGRSGHSVALIELSGVPAARQLGVRVLDSDAVPPPPIPHIKTCSALPHILAAGRAASLGVHEVIRVHDGWLGEGISANLFFERDGRLYTPDSGLPVYPGTVRRRVIEQAGALGIEVLEGRWRTDDLRECAGAFLTGSVRGVEPILTLDDRTLPATDLTRSVAIATEEARRAAASPLSDARR
jgi:branched-subunit amino acid aminotransferase/4-amino-4-deoxychorismate lyase